jgi:hypothetical protein
VKSVFLLLAAAVVALVCFVDVDKDAHAQLQTDDTYSNNAVQLAAYYPGVATYVSDKQVGAELELDTAYQPKPRETVIQYANYANYAGNYATGQAGQVRYQNHCNQCYGASDAVFYGWSGNGFPILRAGLRVATFPARAWLRWAPVRRLFGRC